MKKLNLKYKVLFGIAICLSACSRFVEVEAPSNRITGDVVFLEDATATAAVNGRYAKFIETNRHYINGGLSMFLAMYADETTTNQTTVEYRDFVNATLTSGNSIIYNNFWRTAYENIYQINRCLVGLQNATTLTPTVKNQLQGECYFLRAFCYFYLTNLFGDVPLSTEVNYESNSMLSRTSTTAVYTQMKEDLLKARDLLKPGYPTSGKFRANKYVATALLARVCLYAEQWQDAETYSTEVINSGLYGLPSPATAFLEASSEAIWQLTIDGQIFNTIEGNVFVPSATGTTLPQYPLTTSLKNVFESTDLRLANWVGSKTVSGITYYYPAKYKNRGTTTNPKTEQPIVLRLGEQYLVRAEARFKQNNLSGAVDDLKIIRNRAGLTTNISTNDPVEVQKAMMKERRTELFAEYGHRWFDLKRTGNLDATLSYKPEWQSTDRLFPIPQAEILTNTNLTPNPGY
uniref:RagB/SusD family nutrient uptake outer membrane protein n=1 Tax=Pedobacter schmidteae TaxID=2201271 RepID=UPI000EB2121B|nr:RagB/SusD family nutrient uptake outer membrane protein [Pedobacter schmidteae]